MMTNERAIEILDPTYREKYDSIDVVNEACEIGMLAIKTLGSFWHNSSEELPNEIGHNWVLDCDGKIKDADWNGSFWTFNDSGTIGAALFPRWALPLR